jgi:predicted PurR-regulated permease PerM
MKPMEEKKIVHTISAGSILKTILILIAVALLFYLRSLLFIILTSIIIASAVEPSVRWFVKRSMPRLLAVILIYFIVVILILGVFYLLVPAFITDLAGFMKMLPHYITGLDVQTNNIFNGWQTTVQGLSQSQSIGDAVQNTIATITTASGSVLQAVATIFGGAASFGLIFFISFYLAVEENSVEQFLRLITPYDQENYVADLWKRTQIKIGLWVQGQLLLAVIVGVLVFIGLTILQVKNALFLSMVSALFEVVPVFGPFIGSIPGVIVGFLQHGFTFALIVALMYLIIQQLESNVIYPIIGRRFLGLPPLVVIISLIVGAELGGFLGVLISIPVMAGVMEFVNDMRRYRVTSRKKVTTVETVEAVEIQE